MPCFQPQCVTFKCSTFLGTAIERIQRAYSADISFVSVHIFCIQWCLLTLRACPGAWKATLMPHMFFAPSCRKMWAICSSGWRRSWRPLRGSLMCSHWSLGGEQQLIWLIYFTQSTWPEAPTGLCPPKQDDLWPSAEMPFWHVYVMCKRSPYYNALCLFASLLLPPLPSLLILPFHLPGWRSVARRCPCSPGRSWCSSAPSYCTARCTSLAPPSTTAAPHTPCSSSSSSSLSAGEGPVCCVHASSS